MQTWNDYKAHVKNIDSAAACDIEEAEELSTIIGAIVTRRKALGFSQRALADECGMPQSSVARIESFKTKPNLETVIKLMRPLGLKLTVSIVD